MLLDGEHDHCQHVNIVHQAQVSHEQAKGTRCQQQVGAVCGHAEEVTKNITPGFVREDEKAVVVRGHNRRRWRNKDNQISWLSTSTQ